MPRLDASNWARIGAIGFVILAIVATALQVGRGHDEEALSPTARETPAPDYLAVELERCRTIAPDGPRDDACERAWAESRRRFLGVKAPAASPPVEMFPSGSAPQDARAAPPSNAAEREGAAR